MNLIDAIKSGKPYRRQGESDWVLKWDGCFSEWLRYENCRATFTAGDILADNWEIQEPTVTITRAQLEKAITQWIHEVDGLNISDGIASRLGFPEEKGGG